MAIPPRIHNFAAKPTVMKHLLAIIFASVAVITGQAETIYVSSQADFDALNATIARAISRGEKTIDIQLEPMAYFFKENHLSITHRQWSDAAIAIHGNGATVIAQGRDLGAGDVYDGAFSHSYGYVSAPELAPDGQLPSASESKADIPLWGDLLQASANIDIVNEQAKLCRLRHPSVRKMSREQCKDMYIQVTQWFKSSIYKVDHTERGLVFFTADDLTYNNSYRCHSVNLDYGFGKLKPRFRLCNSPTNANNLISIYGGHVQLPPGVAKVHECQATRFLNLSYSSLRSFTIEGVNFVGNANSDQYLIYIHSNQAERIQIATCSFNALRSGIIQVLSTPNVSITTCQFLDCYNHGIVANSADHIRITDNDFCRMGLALLNTFCVRLDGADYLVGHNELSDFGYGGIAVGVWWAREKKSQCKGIVEYNHLYYTPAYADNVLAHSLMDSGAIYVYTQNDQSDIRYNYIHNYTGAYENRGIFCDDGAYNFNIYGNVIRHTPNSYAIDSRRVLNIETNPKSFAHRVNHHIRIYDNVTDGSIRFEPRDSNADCHLGDNPHPTNQALRVSNLKSYPHLKRWLQ